MTDITGTSGNDFLDNGPDGGTMTGLEGDDFYVVNNPDDVIVENENEGYDIVDSTVSFILPDHVEDLTLSGLETGSYGIGNDLANFLVSNQGELSSTLDGRGGDDSIFVFGFGDNTISGGTGNDFLGGGFGNDTFLFSLGDGQDRITEFEGIDRIVFDSTVEASSVSYFQDIANLIIKYGDGDDQIEVALYFDPFNFGTVETIEFADGTVHDFDYISLHLQSPPLEGGFGDDFLDNGPGGGEMIGHEGDDWYVVNHAGDIVTEYEGEGVDTVDSSIDYTLTDNVENLFLSNFEATSVFGAGNDLGNTIQAAAPFASITLEGNGGDDTLRGGDIADTLIGGTGDDLLYGSQGEDAYFFASGDGQDTIQGEFDTTRIIFDETVSVESVTYEVNPHGLVIHYGDGDSVFIDNFFIFPPNFASIDINVEFSDGTVHDSGYIVDYIVHLPQDVYGTSGNDFLDNGLGGGLMVGYEGNDHYIVNAPEDVVVENPNEGIDEVQSLIDYTLPDNVERLLLGGSEVALTGTGNEQDNLIIGQSGSFNSILDGRGGDDTLSAQGDGDNTIIGGTGNDLLNGNQGDDTYLFSLGDGQDTVNDGADIDRIVFDASVSPADVTYTKVGDELVILYGTNDSITVLGYFTPPGQSTLDRVVETVEFADGTIHDVAYITEIATNTPPDAHIDSFFATYGDVVTGNVLADNGSGADGDADGHALSVTTASVVSANGVAVDISASGDFTYATEAGFVGSDSFTYTVTDGYGGFDSATVTLDFAAPEGAMSGTEEADEIHAGGGGDIVLGLDGNDDIFGGSGSDVLYGGAGDDNLLAGSGHDVIYGESGDDFINSGSGHDTMSGGAGNDTLEGGSGNDTMSGGSGDDVLNGGSGHDVMSGGAGADIMTGGSGHDSFVFTAATAYDGIDIVTDFDLGDSDRLDISDLLGGYDPLSDVLADFVHLADDAFDTAVMVDADGAGTAYGWVQIATLQGVTGLDDESALVTSGNLIV